MMSARLSTRISEHSHLRAESKNINLSSKNLFFALELEYSSYIAQVLVQRRSTHAGAMNRRLEASWEAFRIITILRKGQNTTATHDTIKRPVISPFAPCRTEAKRLTVCGLILCHPFIAFLELYMNIVKQASYEKNADINLMVNVAEAIDCETERSC